MRGGIWTTSWVIVMTSERSTKANWLGNVVLQIQEKEVLDYEVMIRTRRGNVK
mgnify:CR=1 FL=1